MTVDKFSTAQIQRAYQQHQDKLILIVVVGLSLYLIAFLAEVTWRLIDNSQPSSIQKPFNTQVSNRPNTNLGVDISGLTALNLFGDPVAPEPVEVEETAIAEVPETRLDLTLSGVVSSTDPTLGAAIIERNNTQLTYGTGDKIEGTNAILEEIYSDRVIIKNRLVKETLMLDGIDFEEANRQIANNRVAASKNQVANAGNASNTQNITAGSNVSNVRQAITASPTSFTDFIRVQAHMESGQLIGYKVAPGRQPEFFTQVGLQNGDIVTEINGLAMSDFQQALQALEALKEADSLQLEIIRGGDTISLNINMPSA